MLRLPMEDLTPELPLRDEIRSALNGTFNAERALLGWLEANENGDWEACDAVIYEHGLDQDKMLACYAEAVVWAETALQSAI